MRSNFYLFIFLFSSAVFGQSAPTDTSKVSIVAKEFIEDFDTIITYGRGCSFEKVDYYIVLLKHRNKWKYYTVSVIFRSTEDGLRLKKIKTRRKLLSSAKVGVATKHLIDANLLAMNEDSINVCESKPILNEGDKWSHTIKGISTGGCNYGFEFITKEEMLRVNPRPSASLESCQNIIEVESRAIFMRCQKIMDDNFYPLTKE